MKNIQIIDDADNCTFEIYQATEAEFRFIFPGEGQEIEFSELLTQRSKRERRKKELDSILNSIWGRWINKRDVVGIHGTIFFGKSHLLDVFPSKKWDLSADELQIVLKTISKI